MPNATRAYDILESTDAGDAMRVLLVVMPFGAIESPMLGVSTIKAHLRRDGIACEIAYLNMDFARAAGLRAYQHLCETAGEVFAGEWVFSEALFGSNFAKRRAYIDEVVIPSGALTREAVQSVVDMAKLAPSYLSHCLRSVAWDRYDVVGFTSMFEQNLASLALAKRVKERHPRLRVVMGGANAAGPMGMELARRFSFLDAVFTGEADHSFPEYLRRLAAGQSVAGLPGVSTADAPQSPPRAPVRAMDWLPYPDFEDFFPQANLLGSAAAAGRALLMETSRGCWWGQKHQCRFCGLNRAEIGFRSKSPARALDEILHLVARYGVREVMPVDNILDLSYLKSLMPELRRRQPGIGLFFETKANLRRHQLQILAEAGVRHIQPGIESFSSNILRLMGKGVGRLQNAQLLRWARELGVNVSWNLLFGLPAETDADYRDALEAIRALEHLQAPVACSWVRLYRFSPLFEGAKMAGLRDVRPALAYEYVYDLPQEALANLAYAFDFDFDGKEKIGRWARPVQAEATRWQANPEARLEVVSRTPAQMLIADTRPARLQSLHRLTGAARDIVEFCDEIRTTSAIAEHLRQVHGAAPAKEALQALLARLVQGKLLMREEDRFLSLVVSRRARARREWKDTWQQEGRNHDTELVRQ